MFVIGVAGQAQNGKDTLADQLQLSLNTWEKESLDKKMADELIWNRSAFASAVKKVFCDTFGVDLAFVEQWKTVPEAPPGFDMPVRQALQFIGDGFRKIRSTIWLDLAFRDKSVPKIISDVRYINEFVRVKQEGGLNILVARPDKLNDDPNGSEAQIRPYVEWALNRWRGHKDQVVDLRKVNWPDLRKYGPNDPHFVLPPPHFEMFDIFVCNCGDRDALLELVDIEVAPLAKNHVFEFPEWEKERNTCLISS